MMGCTERCGRWAQWKVTVPEKDSAGKITGFRTIALLCGEHKKEMRQAAQADPKVDLRFNFVGAVPDGSYDPKS